MSTSTLIDIKLLENSVFQLIFNYHALSPLPKLDHTQTLIMNIYSLVCEYLKANSIVLPKGEETCLLDNITVAFHDVYSPGENKPFPLFKDFWPRLVDIFSSYLTQEVKKEETEFNVKQFLDILCKEKTKGINWNERPQRKSTKCSRKEFLVRACIDGIVNNKPTENYENNFNKEFPNQEPLRIYLLKFACLYDKLPAVLRLCDELTMKDKHLSLLLPYTVMGNSVSVFSYLIGRLHKLEDEDDDISSAIAMAVALNRVSFVDVFYYKFGVNSCLSVLSPSKEMDELIAGSQ